MGVFENISGVGGGVRKFSEVFRRKEEEEAPLFRYALCVLTWKWLRACVTLLFVNNYEKRTFTGRASQVVILRPGVHVFTTDFKCEEAQPRFFYSAHSI